MSAYVVGPDTVWCACVSGAERHTARGVGGGVEAGAERFPQLKPHERQIPVSCLLMHAGLPPLSADSGT